MRPDRLELEGFGPFRQRTVVDFAGCDLFALTGPTGSGKSSLVDSIVFALYGSIPRYDRRQVGAVVTKGTLAGRVRLDFTLGSHEYTVVRSVRVDARGKVSTEARLEKGDDVLAGSVREVDAAMEGLLGLTFDQFTKCVVLPQGEFSGFLHSRPADRGDLLVALLDLGMFDRVAEGARVRQARLESESSLIEASLKDGEQVDEATIEAVEKRVRTLESLLRRVEKGVEELAEVAAGELESQAVAARLEEQRKVLKVSAPAGLDRLAARLAELRGSLEEARRRASEAAEKVAAAESNLEAGPNRAALVRFADLWQQRADVEETVARLAEADALAGAALAEAARSLQVARAELEDLRRAHEADHLRSALTQGEPCPVCEQVVESVPPAMGPSPLTNAERGSEEARARHSKADRARATAAADLSGAQARLTELTDALAGAPAAGAVASELERLDTIEGRLKEARAERERATAAEARLRSDLDGLSKAEKDAKLELQERLVALAGLGPPKLDLDDLAGSWRALLGFVAESAPRLDAEIADAGERLAALRSTGTAMRKSMVDDCRSCGVETTAEGARDAVFQALTQARAGAERSRTRLDEIRRLGRRRSELTASVATAKTLSGHLRANRFEKWLLDEALRVLAAGANRRLSELAGGQYSLALDPRLDFVIVDHHSADERRPVASLSGGETFLVSLALALSLADHIAAMSAVGTSRLEAIFLDEGFGTLDPEALEAAASVIADIGAGGKMVGIITHVRDLSEMVPVRFEVTKSASGATVRKVGA